MSARPAVSRDLERVEPAMATAARNLGWSETRHTEIAAKVPSPLTRADLTALLKREPSLVHALETAVTARDNKVSDIAALDKSIAASPQTETLPSLTSALPESRALDYAATVAAARTALKEAERSEADHLAALTPWRGTAVEVKSQNAPAPDEANRLNIERVKLEALHTNASDALRNKESAFALARTRCDHHEREHDLVSLEALRAIREERDALWQVIRSGERSLDAGAEAYEHDVRAADSLADRRYGAADHIAKGRELREAVLMLQTEVETAKQRLDEIDD